MAPSLAYVVAELIEHARFGELPVASSLVVGVLFQLPLGPLAAIVARRLLRAVERLVGVGARRPRFAEAAPRWFMHPAPSIRLRSLERAIAGRAPPLAM